MRATHRMAAAAAAAAAADEEEGIAEVGWKMPAQWTDGAWRACLLPRRLARLLGGVPIAGFAVAQLRVLPSDEAEVLHRQRNPVTQTFEYYVHYVECARRPPPVCPAPSP